MHYSMGRRDSNILASQRNVAAFALAVLYVLSWTGALAGAFSAAPVIDIPFHFLGGFFVTLFFADALQKTLVATGRGAGTQAAVLVGIVIFVGLGWELYEYALTVLIGDFLAERNIACCIGTSLDTVKDLFMDTAGAAVVVLFTLRYRMTRGLEGP